MTTYTPAQLRELCERLNEKKIIYDYAGNACGAMLPEPVRIEAASAITFLLTRVEPAIQALKAVEWGGNSTDICPDCCAFKTEGHKPDCIVAAALTTLGIAAPSQERTNGG